MISAVLDSNIYLSAFLFKGKQREILQYAIEGKFTVFISEDIISELYKVLHRPKFRLSPQQIKFFLNQIETLCTICYPSQAVTDVCRDTEDHIIIECALESDSDYIVTGDKDLLVLNNFEKSRIVKSDDFIEIIKGKFR